MVLLLAGVVVGVLLTALSDLVIPALPRGAAGQAGLPARSTSFFGWPSVVALAAVLALALPLAVKLSRTLDALVLGEASAASLGLPLPACAWRWWR